MLTYEDMIGHFLMTSGQFMMSIEEMMLDKPMVISLITRELAYYGKYLPRIERKSFKLYDQKVFNGVDEDGHPQDIPVVINKIFMRSGVTQLFTNNRFGNITKSYWRYNDGMFTTSLPEDIYLVEYAMLYSIDPATGNIEGLDITNNYFLDLVSAKLMIALGRSRRSFFIGELPFTLDSDQMVADGMELLKSAQTAIIEQAKYYLAFM